jgi:hypothetical protein
VTDGFADPVANPPVYSINKTQKGGVWAAKRAIVLLCDGSVNNLACDASALAPLRTSGSGSKLNMFATSDATWLSSANTAVNPE